MYRIKITYKLAFVLVTLSTGPLMLSAFLGLIPLDDRPLLQSRMAVVESIASAISPAVDQPQQGRKVEILCNDLLQSRDDLRGLRVRRFDGATLYESQGFIEYWNPDLGDASVRDQIQIPLVRSEREWARIDILFVEPPWYQLGIVKFCSFVLIVVIVNALSFILFLNRSLAVLEPNNAVPRRVRNTLDTIAGGVVVLDRSGKIMLANESFVASLAGRSGTIVGGRLNAIDWRIPKGELPPWEIVLQEKRRSEGSKIFLPDPSGGLHHERCFVVNATPVLDGDEKLAGALLSFEDVTALEEQRKSLVVAMTELEASKDKIRVQNERLQELASRDTLTGAFNRRVLFENMEEMWNDRELYEHGVTFMMMDIDHFKKLNDRHGHAAGDKVLKEFVGVLQGVVQDRGIFGRYGGEEFCLLIANATDSEGLEIAEQVRMACERDLAIPYSVTASLGISSSSYGADSYKRLLEQADKGLYAAKNSGRNRTCRWTPEIDRMEEEAKKRSLELQASAVVDDHLISYHAVVSLYSALTFRHANTALHSQRVAELSVALGRGLLSVGELYTLEIAALLHDIGKIGLPDEVLMHPGTLDKDQSIKMQAHSPIGLAIVQAAFDCDTITNVMRFHHCRFDGADQDGDYPVGEDIPLVARIVAITDAFDAMVSEQVYRKALSVDEAFEELRQFAGSQFDPVLVERFIQQKSGWRIDSRYLIEEPPDRNALNLGYFMERVVHSFDSREPISLSRRLEKLRICAEQSGMLHIAMIAAELQKDADRKSIGEWESLSPMVDDLIDVCLTVQRAFLTHIGAKPINVNYCPSRDYFANKMIELGTPNAPHNTNNLPKLSNLIAID